ncbi:MAG: hypothetical protein IPJ65_09785 [Archangiaceae bacterium]|nr:hypothetical protein [Archangiaceae bacterium]
MMRNVAIGAVLGFGLVVLLLTVFKADPPVPPAPAAVPVVTAAPAGDADGGMAAALVPMNAAPVVVTPNLKALPDSRRLMMRQMLREQHDAVRNSAVVTDGG